MMYLEKIVFTFFITIFSPLVFSENIKIITISVAPWAYPLEHHSEVYVGIFPSVVSELKRRTGHDFKITLTDFGFMRIDRELSSGRQDCAVVIGQAGRDKITVRGETVVLHEMGVLARKGIDLNDYADLYGLTISSHPVLVEEGKFLQDRNLTIEYDDSYLSGLKKIKHGRLDAVAGSIDTIEYLANHNGMKDLLGKALLLESEAVYLQCSKKSEKLKHMGELNEAIQAMKKDGTLDSILENFS